MQPYSFLCGLIALLGSLPALAVTIEGSVLRDDTVALLVSAEVRVAREGDRYLAAHLETDRQGRFRAEGLPEGRYTLTVSKRGYLETTLKLPDDGMPLQVRMIRAASISGKVLWRNGKPMERASVYLMERAKTGALRELRLSTAFSTTKSDGTFRLYGLPPGTYALAMNYQGKDQSGGMLFPDAANPRLFTLKGGEEIRDCDFVADPELTYSVAGKVEPLLPDAAPEVPADGAKPKREPIYSVGLAPAAQPGVLIAWVQTGADASFRLPSIPAGDYEIFVAGPVMGYSGRGSVLARDGDLLFGRSRMQVNSDVKDLRLPLAAARTVNLRLEPGRFGQAGCPASLELRMASVEAWGTELRRTLTLPFGETRPVNNLAPALYQITIARPLEDCGLLATPAVDLREGDLPEPVLLTAGGKGSIAGKVLDASPGSALEVVLVPIEGAPHDTISVAPANATGDFEFLDLRPGRYGLAVRSRGEGNAEPLLANAGSMVEVDVLGGRVEILLNAPVSRASGRVAVP